MNSEAINLCLVHNQPLSQICVHYQCNYFNPLCDACMFNHDLMHEKKDKANLLPVSCLVNYSKKLDYANTRSQLEEDLKTAKTNLEQMIESLNEALKIKTDSQLENLFTQIDEIHTQVNFIFSEFKEEINKRHRVRVNRLDSQIIHLYEDLRASHETCTAFMVKPLMSKQVKRLRSIDLNYQICYKQTKTSSILWEKNKLKFEAELVGEYKMKLFTSIRQNLKNMLNFDEIQATMPRDTTSRDLLSNASDTAIHLKNQNLSLSCTSSPSKHWLFYFKPKTRTFYYQDMTAGGNNLFFYRVNLSMDEMANIGNCSVQGEDGQIYYLGGVNGKINVHNEAHYKKVFQLDFNARQLTQVGSMLTQRSFFGVAALGKYLYIVGGLNYLEGTLMKCERLDLESKESQPINFLNSPSSHHSLCSYQDKYLFKFGGLRRDDNKTRQLVEYMFERYSVEKDVWQRIVLKDNSNQNLLPKLAFHGGIYDINDNQLLIVGGQSLDNELINQCFLLHVGDSSHDQQSLFIKDMNTKPLPKPMIFKDQSYLILRKQLYVVGTSTLEDEKKICMFDGRTWKVNKV